MFTGLLITHIFWCKFQAEGQAHKTGDVENEIYYLQMKIIMPSVSHLKPILCIARCLSYIHTCKHKHGF